MKWRDNLIEIDVVILVFCLTDFLLLKDGINLKYEHFTFGRSNHNIVFQVHLEVSSQINLDVGYVLSLEVSCQRQA